MVRQYIELVTTAFTKDEAESLLEEWKRIIEMYERIHGVVVLTYTCSTVETYEKEWHPSGSFMMAAHYRPTFVATVNKYWTPSLEKILRRTAWARPAHLNYVTYLWREMVLREFQPYTFAFDVETRRLRNVDISVFA